MQKKKRREYYCTETRKHDIEIFPRPSRRDLSLRIKTKGSWSIPKGEFPDDEEALAAAIREFW